MGTSCKRASPYRWYTPRKQGSLHIDDPSLLVGTGCRLTGCSLLGTSFLPVPPVLFRVPLLPTFGSVCIISDFPFTSLYQSTSQKLNCGLLAVPTGRSSRHFTLAATLTPSKRLAHKETLRDSADSQHICGLWGGICLSHVHLQGACYVFSSHETGIRLALPTNGFHAVGLVYSVCFKAKAGFPKAASDPWDNLVSSLHFKGILLSWFWKIV